MAICLSVELLLVTLAVWQLVGKSRLLIRRVASEIQPLYVTLHPYLSILIKRGTLLLVVLIESMS